MHTNIDREPTTRFLKLLDPEAKHFTFQTFHDKKPPTKPDLARVVESPAEKELLRLHADGAGIYVTVNQTNGKGRKAENVVRVRAVFQEDDGGHWGPFPLEPSLIVETSPGHFHRYWLTDDWPADEQGRKDFAAVMERMVESYGSDKNAKDIVRVLRVPGFLHRKGDACHLVHIIEASGKRYSRAEILAAFPPVVREKKETTRYEYRPQGDDDQRIREALDRIYADDRYVWLQIGMALKDEYGDSGRGLWDQWSLRSKDKFNDRDQEKTWHSFRRHGIGIGTLFHHAKRAGWRGEESRRHEPHSGGAENNNGAGNGSGTQVPSERTAILVRADSLTPESISWAWKNRFAFGKMAMLAGDPGLGKTTVLIEIVASHSRGGEFPCNEGKAFVCETVYLTAEDGLRDTLVPRLIAADADRTKVHFLTGTKIEGAGADEMTMFDIAQDVAVLRKVFVDNPNIKILVIDPITAYLGAGAKAKENTDVRRVLTPLVKLIEEFGVLLLVNNHLNKSSGKALYRILDSIAFVALGRTIHLVIEDADSPEIKKLLCHKSNIGSKPLGLTYFIQKTWIPGEQGEEIETSRIVWGLSIPPKPPMRPLPTIMTRTPAPRPTRRPTSLPSCWPTGR